VSRAEVQRALAGSFDLQLSPASGCGLRFLAGGNRALRLAALRPPPSGPAACRLGPCVRRTGSRRLPPAYPPRAEAAELTMIIKWCVGVTRPRIMQPRVTKRPIMTRNKKRTKG